MASKKMHRTEMRKGPLMRVSFARNLRYGRDLKKDDGTTKMEFGCTLILPKADGAGMKFLQGMVAEVIRGEWGDRGVERFKTGLIRNPILAGDGKEARNKESGEINPGFGTDVVFIRAKSNEIVPVFNAKVAPAADEEIVSGHWGYPVLNAFAWHHPTNGDGVSFGISMFQFVKADDVLGGERVSDPNKFFEHVDMGDGGASAGDASSMFD